MNNKTFLFTLMAGVALSPFAYAQLNKHDSSIATYNYNIAIQEDSSPVSSGDLRTELDQGTLNATPTNLNSYQPAAPSPAGAVQQMQAPQMGMTAAVPLVPAQNVMQVGSQAIDFTLPSSQGGSVSLKEILAKGPTIVLITNGSYAPFSAKQLQLLQKNSQQFKTLGIQVIALSPEPVATLQRTQSQYGLSYPVLSDINLQVISSFGLSNASGITPALYTLDASGKVAAVQLQSQATKVFDLTVATDPVRTQASVAPTPSRPTSPETAVPSTQVAPPSSQQAPAMPPVPPAQAGKVSYDVPPSNPAFGKVNATKYIAI